MSDLVETRYCADEPVSVDASLERLVGLKLVLNDQSLISRDAETRALSAWALLIDRYFDTPVVSFVVARAGPEHKPIGENAVKRLSLQIEHEWRVQQLQNAVLKAKDTSEGPDGKDSTSNTAVLLVEASDTNADCYRKELEDLFQQLGNVPLLLTMCPTSQGLSLGVYSPRDRRFHIPLQAIVGSLKHSFNAMDRHDTPITGLDLISSYDVQRLRLWAIRGEVEQSRCIHDLISRHYRERQAAIAVSSTSDRVTYEQLGQKSAAIANILRRAGVQPGCTVGFCMNKSTLAIITILGILRAGAVYVPISEGCSAQRMSEILERVEAKHFIAERHIQQRFEDIDPPEIQRIDPVSLDLERIPHAWDRDVDLDPSGLAYIVFTSGSTGKPKGVMHEHHAVAGGLQAVVKSFGLDQSTKFLQFADFAFDASFCEILGPLVSGGQVCVPSEQQRVETLGSVMKALQVTDASLTPVVVNQLQASQVPHLRHLYIGGEAPSQSIIDSWADHVRLSNIYGTSETGIWDTIRLEISRSDNAKNIGRAINANCWVVNPSDVSKLQPVGVKGELLIQTPFLGRGYLGDNATSADAFLPAPNFASQVGGDISLRCYRTGDLARYEQDGSITYCGRESGFIKIRGFRVDLGEVEITVNSCLDHGRAAVIAAGAKERHDAPEIIAFVEVGNINPRPVSASELSERLRSRLPRYMVPTVYIPLPELPCNQSKKIDRPQLLSLFTQLSPTELVALRPGGKALHQWPKIAHRRAIALEISKSISDLVIGSQDSSSETLQGLDFSLSSVGLNSMQLVYLASWIHRRWQRSVSVQTLLQPGITVCQLEEHLLQDLESTEGAPQRNILRDLDNLMQSAQFPNLNIRGRTIFLTSITGFLGTQILRFLLSNPEVDRIVGLVRADSETDARERIHAQATAGGWWKGEFDSRIIVWLGDLNKPKLGLNQSNWGFLCGRAPELHIDGIIHNGARVNWLEGYNRLKAVNVDSTITLLQAYSCRPVPCPFTYVSGGYLPLHTDTRDQIGEKLSTASGYDQTKYLSRLIIEEYNSRLESMDSLDWPQIRIVQPGFIVGTRWEGIAHTEDFLWRLAYCIVSLGAVSEDLEKLWIPVAGADQIASLVIAGMFLKNLENVVDCRQGITVHDFCDILSEQTGLRIGTQNHQQWLASLRKQVDQNPLDHPFTPLLQFVDANDWQLTPVPPNDQSSDDLYRLDTVMALEKSVQYLMGIGFLSCREGHTVVRDGRNQAVFRRSKD